MSVLLNVDMFTDYRCGFVRSTLKSATNLSKLRNNVEIRRQSFPVKEEIPKVFDEPSNKDDVIMTLVLLFIFELVFD